MEKLSAKENPLFNRKEIEIKIISEISPKISEAEEIVAKEFSSSPGNIKIQNIKGKFGSRSFVIKANIYSSKESKEKTERAKKEKKAGAKPEGGNKNG